MYRHGFHEGAFHHGVGVFGLIFFVALLALAVVAVVLLVRASRHTPVAAGGPSGALGGGANANDPALAELRLRYARGEISREEYVQRSADLGAPVTSSPPPPGPPAPPAPPA
ncbi:MAG TPA: SHOCT domain-containing protein [Acidimicrobiales bacterium]|nr:SHOCT domain-containing protein [Acidimicrobiales bacterium]